MTPPVLLIGKILKYAHFIKYVHLNCINFVNVLFYLLPVESNLQFLDAKVHRNANALQDH